MLMTALVLSSLNDSNTNTHNGQVCSRSIMGIECVQWSSQITHLLSAPLFQEASLYSNAKLSMSLNDKHRELCLSEQAARLQRSL